jgi:hypothetical protein
VLCAVRSAGALRASALRVWGTCASFTPRTNPPLPPLPQAGFSAKEKEGVLLRLYAEGRRAKQEKEKKMKQEPENYLEDWSCARCGTFHPLPQAHKDYRSPPSSPPGSPTGKGTGAKDGKSGKDVAHVRQQSMNPSQNGMGQRAGSQGQRQSKRGGTCCVPCALRLFCAYQESKH